MAKSKLWAGLDVGVESTSLCVINAQGEILRECSCASATRAVRHELAAFRRPRFASVIVEAGTGTHLARGLKRLGYPVELYEARALSRFLRSRRNKTDAGDANGIAEAGRIGASMVSKVYLKDFDIECLQTQLTIRRALIRQRVATKGLLGRLFDQFGGRLRSSKAKGGVKNAVQKGIPKVFRDAPPSLTSELRYLADHYDQLEAHQRLIDRELTKVATGNEATKRFMEIPGVGPICALNFYVAVGDPLRFARSADVGSYLGLTPRLHQSGLTFRMGRISKMGNAAVRSLLVQAAVTFLHCSRSDSELRSWAAEVETRRGKGRSRVALARKLSVVMLAMWKNGSHYDPNHAGRGCSLT